MPNKKTVISELNKYLNKKSIHSLYAESFLNRTGNITGERIKYGEFVASQLLLPKNIALLESISSVRRGEGESYNVGHKKVSLTEGAKITEKRLARSMLHNPYAHMGEIIDYETPLTPYKKEMPNKGSRKFGDIDLLSYNEKAGYAYIIEYKRPKSKETLLRCILEVHTYWRTAIHCHLLRDFELPPSTQIRKAVLVHRSTSENKSQPYKDFHSEDLASVRELMKELDIDFFVLEDVSLPK
jgi:hypothetical protein